MARVSTESLFKLALAVGASALVVWLISTIARAEHTVTVRTRQTVVSPLYWAEIDCERRMLKQMVYVVKSSDIVRPVPVNVERNWWQHEASKPFTLEDEDYRRSQYQRGHVRPILLSSGRPEWEDVNCTAVIVPQWPKVNSPLISGLEEHIAELASEHGQVTVIVDCRFESGVMVQLPESDEECEVPSGFAYTLMWRSGRLHQRERFEIPNIETPPSTEFAFFKE